MAMMAVSWAQVGMGSVELALYLVDIGGSWDSIWLANTPWWRGRGGRGMEPLLEMVGWKWRRWKVVCEAAVLCPKKSPDFSADHFADTFPQNSLSSLSRFN